LGDELRSVAGVEMVWPKAGAVLVDQPPMARVGFFIYEWDWGGGWTEPRSDLNGRPSRIPPPSRQVESDEQRLGRKKLWPINREPHTQGVGDIRYSSVELEPTSLMIESKDLRTMTRPETPLGSLDSHTKAVQTSPHVVEQNFEGLNFNAEPVILSRMLGRTSREPFVDRVEAGERAVNLRPELSIRNPEIPSEPSTARYTGEHPFDYNSHYQTYLQAHQVMDPATDFRKTEHQEETRRLGPAPPHERIHKITQKDFIDRADPRIQEVIMAKERVDTFGLVKAVQFEGRAAEGSPTYNDHGQAIHFATKGTLVDTLAVDWAGPHSER
jgi:hypothetical protein